MAHKKAGGSTRNGRDSESKRLGVKVYGGQVVKAGNLWEPGNQPEILFGQMDEYDKNFLAAYGYQKFSDFVNQPIELAPWGEAWHALVVAGLCR